MVEGSAYVRKISPAGRGSGRGGGKLYFGHGPTRGGVKPVKNGERREEAMRYFGAVATIFFALAAVGQASDVGIPWVESPGKCSFPFDGDVALISDDVETVAAAYRLTWRREGVDDVDFVEAEFYSWEVHCAKTKNRLQGYEFPAEAIERSARTSGPLFPLTVVFYVTVGAYELSYAELPNDEEWDVYLTRGDVKQLPLRVSPVEGPYLPYNKKAVRDPASDQTEYRDYFRKTYEVTFANAYGEDPPAAVELVVAGRRARCGFAWRFREE